MLLCRDLLMHLDYKSIFSIIMNFSNSHIKYFLISTYENTENSDITTGDARPVNLEAAPFFLPTPIESFYEKGWRYFNCGRKLSLWSRSQLNKWAQSNS